MIHKKESKKNIEEEEEKEEILYLNTPQSQKSQKNINKMKNKKDKKNNKLLVLETEVDGNHQLIYYCTNKNFKNKISTFEKLKMKNEKNINLLANEQNNLNNNLNGNFNINNNLNNDNIRGISVINNPYAQKTVQVINDQIVILDQKEENNEKTNGKDEIITSLTYTKNKGKKTKWNDSEEKVFFDGLNLCGCDFSLLNLLFPKKTRKCIKKKYMNEIKKDPVKINNILKNFKVFNKEEFDALVRFNV